MANADRPVVSESPKANVGATPGWKVTLLALAAAGLLGAFPSSVHAQAVNDSFTVNEDTTLSVPAPGVLSNDTFILITALSAPAPANSQSFAISIDGSFTYVPSLNFCGQTSFTYTITDFGLFTSSATVTLNVTCVNDAPSATNDSYSTNEDTPLVIAAPGVLSNDTDVESSPLTAVSFSTPPQGSLVPNGNGSFTYTPNLNFNGTDTFTYFANDGSLDSLNPATVTITVNPVNDRPVANDDSYSTNEDTPLVIAATRCPLERHRRRKQPSDRRVLLHAASGRLGPKRQWLVHLYPQLELQRD